MVKYSPGKDDYFLYLVNKGRLYVNKKGEVWNTKTENRLGWVNHKGYIEFQYNGFKMLVHRLVWLVYVGKIPKGLEINHKNKVRGDANLENLEVVTVSQNQLHSYNGNHRIPATLARECRRLKKRKLTDNEIGLILGLTASTVQRYRTKY